MTPVGIAMVVLLFVCGTLGMVLIARSIEKKLREEMAENRKEVSGAVNELSRSVTSLLDIF